ncbi:UNVERIFIED_CONTAM: hypothetical protein Sradi_3664700 [Sesamum radiatum]|uniref:CID domain-containing protein n=1 Tax=Sesamum radiatum TaxID=300843 RepID=A0AAW2QIL5_SESRA
MGRNLHCFVGKFVFALSGWCMLHHKRADQIIVTWDKHLPCPEVVQKVPLLFLANDILLHSKAKVNGFIQRFSKILPSALKRGLAEKIVSAFELVLHDHANEDKEMRKCKSEVHRVEKLEKDVDKALNKGKDSLQRTVTKRLKDEKENLEKSIEKSRSFEANRATLVFQLQDALREQVCDHFYIRIRLFLGYMNFSIFGLPLLLCIAPVQLLTF